MTLNLLKGHRHDLGGFVVNRVLPAPRCRAVGPFVFFDHVGPAVLAADGLQVRPHPHIGLATVTFLFDGEIVHRDSLGTVQSIRPGDVNWMTAGRGIVHSERSPDVPPGQARTMHAIQSWVALPVDHENDEPSFSHHPAATLPTFVFPGIHGTLIAGTGFGLTSPVAVPMPTLYASATMKPGAMLRFADEHDERAVFVVSGAITVNDVPVAAGTMAVLGDPAEAILVAREPSIVMLLGGARLDAPRVLEWNFVSSTRQAIDRARADWSAFPNARFPQVPGETEWIPLPPRPRPEPTAL
jgi:redox-sensitive bicupin YhaK (pirin superfamily)